MQTMLLLPVLLLFFCSAVFALPSPASNPRQSETKRQFCAEPAPQTFPDAPAFAFAGDAPYPVPKASLSHILNCPKGLPTSSSTKTVLLVHGTGSTGYESWAHGYVLALADAGYTPCYVTLPNRSSGDLQLTAGYVAYNLHLVSWLAGGNPISVIGHSQGGPDIQWALRFFPSTRTVTKIFVGLSPDLGPGTTYFREMCDLAGALGACDAASWQQASNSNYYTALNHKNEAFVNSTFIWTSADEIVTPPQPNAVLSGATSIEVQAVCPQQMPSHFEQLINPTTYAIALDALEHDGHASASRIPPSACVGDVTPGMNITIPVIAQAALGDLIQGSILATPKLLAEPSVIAYAQVQNQ